MAHKIPRPENARRAPDINMDGRQRAELLHHEVHVVAERGDRLSLIVALHLAREVEVVVRGMLALEPRGRDGTLFLLWCTITAEVRTLKQACVVARCARARRLKGLPRALVLARVWNDVR